MSEDIQDEMREEPREEGSNRIAWFLTGALVGTTIGMLLAPKSGRDTRQFLNDKTHQGREAVTDTGKDIVEASREMFERGRKLVEDAADLFERGRKLVKG